MARYTPIVKLALGADLTRGPGAYEWTDITDLVRGPVTYQEGNTGNGALPELAPASRLTFDAANDSGRWCEDLPTSPWVGRLWRGLPVRVDMGTTWTEVLDDDFGRTEADSWGSVPLLPGSTAYTGYPWTITSNDSDFDVTGGAGTITVTSAAPTDRSAYLENVYETDAQVHIRWTMPLATGASLRVSAHLRAVELYEVGYLVRVSATTANAVQLDIVRLDGGGSETVLYPATSTGLTHAAATALNLMARIDGQTISVKVWQGDPGTEPGSWTASVTDAVADVADEPGYVGIVVQKSTGNTNVNPVISVRDFSVSVPPVEATGFLADLPQMWDGGKMNPVVKITAQGAARRLSKHTSPTANSGLNPGLGSDAWSSQRRASVDPDYDLPIVYYPFEDEDESDTIASGLPGEHGVFIGGGLDLGESAGDLPGTRSVAQLQAGSWFSATVPTYTSSNTELSMWVNLRFETWPVMEAGLFSFGTDNHYWRVVFVPGSPRRIKVWAIPAGTFIDVLNMTGIDIDVYGLERGLEIGLQLSQNGADTDWAFTVRDYDTDSVVTGTEPGLTFGTLRNIVLAGSTDVTGVQFAHWAFYKSYSSGRGGNSSWGWKGEGASERVVRVLREAGVRVSSTPTAADPALGPERAGSVQSLVREAAKVDGGMLVPDRRNFGLRYVTRDWRYNRDALLTLDPAAGHLLQEFKIANDDSSVTNDHTASRPNGSEYRYVDQAHVDRYGYEPTGGQYNAYTDSELASIAKHVVALSTLRGGRPGEVSVALHKSTSLESAWRRREVGSLIVIDSPGTTLPQLPLDDLPIELVGWWQQMHAEGWDVRIFSGRGTPWSSMVLGGDGSITQPRWRLQASDHTLSAGINSSTTSITVAAGTDAGLWQTGATSGSPQIIIGGLEVCTVSNITGAASPQTFTVSRSVNGVSMAHSAGATVRVHGLAGIRR